MKTLLFRTESREASEDLWQKLLAAGVPKDKIRLSQTNPNTIEISVKEFDNKLINKVFKAYGDNEPFTGLNS